LAAFFGRIDTAYCLLIRVQVKVVPVHGLETYGGMEA